MLEQLDEGKRVIIFPENDPPRNEIIYEFQNRFIDLGSMYHRRTGKDLCFVPMYAAPALHRVVLGKPLYYDGNARAEDERERLNEALIAGITDLARSLPRHRVVPYRNLPKRDYPMSLPDEVTTK